jgi:hypothetical protein
VPRLAFRRLVRITASGSYQLVGPISTDKRPCSREELWLHAKSPNNSVTEAICSAFGSLVKVSHHYQPITALLYASRMATVASAIQADKV